MEDVLDLYAEPYDPDRTVVSFDERPLHLVAETRTPLPPTPGRPQRYDYEYQRKGTGNVFTSVEPQVGRRHIEVTEQRTAVDFATPLKPRPIAEEGRCYGRSISPDAGRACQRQEGLVLILDVLADVRA